MDLPILDTLAATGNEMTLTRFAERLPEPDLREQANGASSGPRRAVGVRRGARSSDRCRRRGDSDGHNRVVLDDHRLVRAWFDESQATIRDVRRPPAGLATVRHAARLTQATPDAVGAPESCRFGAACGRSCNRSPHPVTLCTSKRALDPTPCIAIARSPSTIRLRTHKGGRFHFRDNVAEQEVVPLAARDAFTLPVALDGQPAVSLQWGLSIANVPKISISAARARAAAVPTSTFASSTGARVDMCSPFTVPPGTRRRGRGRRPPALSRGEPRRDRVEAGWSGSPGVSGASGGDCGSGGNGGPGGDGGDGGPGGEGGNVNVVIARGLAPRCGAADSRSSSAPAARRGRRLGRIGRFRRRRGSGRSASTHLDSAAHRRRRCWLRRRPPPEARARAAPDGLAGRAGASGTRHRPGRSLSGGGCLRANL